MLTYWVGEISAGNQDANVGSRTFDDKPVVGFKDASKSEGKRRVMRGPLGSSKMNTGTSPITAALHNDASDSAPLSGPESRSKKDRSRCSSISSSFSQ
eukprot:scaffold6938_cov108-Cylindrotheca_fusiformis.AAC.1